MIEYVETREIPLSELAEFPGNARRGDVEAIRASLRASGQYRSLIVRDGGFSLTVLAGNHTMRALIAEGVAAARCEVVRCNDATATRVNLADNKIADIGVYDDDALTALLSSLDGDLLGTGYTDDDFVLLVAASSSVPTLEELEAEHGEPEEDAFWPILTFKVSPEARVRFLALTDDADPDDDSSRFLHLLRRAEESG